MMGSVSALDIYRFSEPQMLTFLLVLLRVSSFVVIWPIFGTPAVPQFVKVLLALVLSLCLFPAVEARGLSGWSGPLIWLGLREVFIGVLLGFLCRLYFLVLDVGGQLMSLSMGLYSGQMYNPSLGGHGSALDQFYVGLATMFFLLINGHHALLQGLVESFRIVPLSDSTLSLAGFREFGRLTQDVMILGLQICAPLMATILFVNLGMGIVGRVVPQVNVLMTSLSVNLIVGVWVLLISMPLFIEEMPVVVHQTMEHLFKVMKSL